MANESLQKLDQSLAQRYGGYASYPHASDPVLVKTYGDGPADEVDRLLDIFATPDCQVLDLGCGAGFTLCRLAPKVRTVWGFDMNTELLAAAQARAAHEKRENAFFVHGNVAVVEDVGKLPDDRFSVVLSRRGPNVTGDLLPKLTSNAVIIQELWQDPLGLLEMFGRKTFLAGISDNPLWLVEAYSWLGIVPVSVKEYFFEAYFRDEDHLAAYLSQPTSFYSWPMPPTPYDEARDREALSLYARYNRNENGVRLLHHRKVYLFRRTNEPLAPAVPAVKPSP